MNYGARFSIVAPISSVRLPISFSVDATTLKSSSVQRGASSSGDGPSDGRIANLCLTHGILPSS